MASSQNLQSFETFLFHSTFPDSWISEAYARDTQTLTRALQSTFSNLTSSDYNPVLNNPLSDSTTTASNVSASSDPDVSPVTTPVPAVSVKRRTPAVPGATVKVAKRKSRASKRSQTTFINADPANFRQMVQQVTGGVRFGNGQVPVVPVVLKPEPQRLGNRLNCAAGAGCMPTLDTSAFLLDSQLLGLESGSGSGSGSDLESISCFPTLESWS